MQAKQESNNSYRTEMRKNSWRARAAEVSNKLAYYWLIFMISVGPLITKSQDSDPLFCWTAPKVILVCICKTWISWSFCTRSLS